MNSATMSLRMISSRVWSVHRGQRTARPGIDKIHKEVLIGCDAMRFLMTMNGGGPAADETLYAEMGRFIEELTNAGVLLATGGLAMDGTHASASGGRVTFTDGPFAESKETIVSFALIDVRSKEEALELSRRFWSIVKDGEGDLRQVFGPE
jgi:hypothetical protein